ncbi:ribonuclease T2 family protein [Methylocella sp.]|uniref:ribonuclease T2 family protein n=1 Tax=Methylocella sp. TaxID=1978226 RepID=UPI00378444A7
MRFARAAVFFAAALAALAPQAGRAFDASGGADDCLLDKCADHTDAAAATGVRPARAARGARGTAGDFDFYVLALSWSPGFCRTPAGARAKSQCAPGGGLGFVTHGLWPQYERGYPQFCPFGAQTPSRLALQAAADVYPSESLARYEWRKHGVCSGKSPTDYFADARRAMNMVVTPPAFLKPTQDQSWTRLDVERAFLAANPRLRPGMIGVVCRGDALAEVRVCMTRDLRGFRACPELARPACPPGAIVAPAPL